MLFQYLHFLNLFLFLYANEVIFNVQKDTIRKVALPYEKGISYILEVNIACNVSVTSCSSNLNSSLFLFEAIDPTYIFLSSSRIDQIEQILQCATEKFLDLEIVSHSNLTGKLILSPVNISDYGNDTAISLEVPSERIFQAKNLEYITLFYNFPSVDNGLSVELYPSGDQETQIYISFCLGKEGKFLANVKFPQRFVLELSNLELVDLIDEYSCDGALYHDLQHSPPTLMLKVRSVASEGLVKVYQDAKYGPFLNSQLFINSTHPFSIQLDSYDVDLNFEVINGTVSVDVLSCEEIVSLGDYTAGIHFIKKNQDYRSYDNCTENFDLLPTIRFSSNVTSSLTFNIKTKDKTTYNFFIIININNNIRNYNYIYIISLYYNLYNQQMF